MVGKEGRGFIWGDGEVEIEIGWKDESLRSFGILVGWVGWWEIRWVWEMASVERDG